MSLELIFAGDWMRDLSTKVPDILASGVRVVVYHGEDDFICNWYGGAAWTNALSWPGQSAFNSAPNTTWTVNGTVAGSARSAQGLTFVRVSEAGHMVPLDQPLAALDLITRIVTGAPFDGSSPWGERTQVPKAEAEAQTKQHGHAHRHRAPRDGSKRRAVAEQ